MIISPSTFGHHLKLNINTVYSVYSSIRLKHVIDRSLIPSINENDLEEKFVRGSGPGGSAVNKNSNCVVLTHKPTGIVIKCHSSRSQDDNRKNAREMLVQKLDNLVNGDNSVSAQIKAREEKKSKEHLRKKKKLDMLKSAWKQREGID